MKKLIAVLTLFLVIGCSARVQLEGSWRYVEYHFTTAKYYNEKLLETVKGVVTYPTSEQQPLQLNPDGTCSGRFNGYWLLVDKTLKIKDSVASATCDSYAIKYLSDTQLILESTSGVETDSLIYETAYTHYFQR